ncbi:MAG TPA: extracellular solute-binding protein [Trebonia sp.]|jgi:multiple sugar transport system substrate-binding protein
MLFRNVARARLGSDGPRRAVPRRVSRRGAAGALAVGLAAAAIAGCSSSGSGSGGSGSQSLSGQTITVYTQAPYGTQLKQYQEYYSYIANAFRKATGSTVKWVYTSSAVSLSQELSQAAASGSGPDVWSIGSSFDGTASALKEFYTIPVSDWNQFGGTSTFVSKQLTMAGPNSSAYVGVPYESIPFVLAYNKALFAKAGIKSAPATWTQFVQDAQAIQKSSPGVSGTSLSPADPYGPWKPVWSYMEQLGGDFLNQAGTTAELTSPQVEAAMKFYFGLYDTYHVVPKADLTWEQSQETSAFLAGKDGMILESAYSLQQEAQGTPVAKDVGFAPMPSVPYGMSARPAGAPEATSIVSGNYYDVAKYYGNLPLALKFIQVSTSAAAQLEQFKIMGWMPVTQAGIAEVEKAYPATVPFIEAEQTSTPTDYSPAWSYIETGVLAAIGHVAQQLATGQPYSESYVNSQLQAENSVVQAHLSGSS